MEYAVVDVETSGNSPVSNRITEIGIVITNGYQILHKYEMLFNPLQPIPIYVQNMTGIYQKNVHKYPVFDKHAQEINQLLQNKIFVAHNVSFDFSFVQQSLLRAGITWTAPYLCTFKLAKKLLPELTKANVGFLANYFGIVMLEQHRAGSDALATAEIFQKLIAIFGIDIIQNFIKN